VVVVALVRPALPVPGLLAKPVTRAEPARVVMVAQAMAELSAVPLVVSTMARSQPEWARPVYPGLALVVPVVVVITLPQQMALVGKETCRAMVVVVVVPVPRVSVVDRETDCCG
jgi:hypothetical protein